VPVSVAVMPENMKDTPDAGVSNVSDKVVTPPGRAPLKLTKPLIADSEANVVRAKVAKARCARFSSDWIFGCSAYSRHVRTIVARDARFESGFDRLWGGTAAQG